MKPYGIEPPGFRLPPETRVGSVRLQVTDLARSLDFYHKLLGFELLAQNAEGVQLGVNSTVLIELNEDASKPHSQRRLGLYHFAILLPDRPALGRCLKRLIRAGLQPGASDHLVSEALYIRDPDGLGIELYRDRPSAEWQVRDNQLAMASDPLDLEEVLASGANAEWSGMPAGTRIGHIHLHVGDIDAAKAFYHTALGFDVVAWSVPGALFLSAGGYHHHLGVNTWAGPQADPPPPDEARLLWWDVVLPSSQSVEAAAASLEGRDYSVVREGSGTARASDPWGTVVCLKQRWNKGF